jgi:chemotaxis protein histidine kinase CheA
MAVDVFTERLAKVRSRFVSTLEGKIEDTYRSLPDLSGHDRATVQLLEETYRRMHSMVGIGPTVGFGATGRAAHNVESVLLPACNAGRGLTAQEFDSLKKALHVLRETARQELQSAYNGWR